MWLLPLALAYDFSTSSINSRPMATPQVPKSTEESIKDHLTVPSSGSSGQGSPLKGWCVLPGGWYGKHAVS